jgi:hypothetical protein
LRFVSNLSPYYAIQKAEEYFEKVANSIVKEKPHGKGDEQMIEIGVSGGRWELYWTKIKAEKMAEEKGSEITIKSRLGLMQLSLGAIVFVLSGPFLYYAIAKPGFFTIFVTVLIALVGILSIIVPIIRIIQMQKQLKQVLQDKI